MSEQRSSYGYERVPSWLYKIHYQKQNIRTPCSRVRLQQPTISRLVKQLPVFYQPEGLLSGNTKPVRSLMLYLHRLARSCCTYNVRVRSCVRWSQSNVIIKHLASLGPSLCFHCCVHHVLVQGRRGQANNLALTPIFFRAFFGLGQGGQFWRPSAQTAYTFRRNSFACGNMSSLAPFFRSFRERLLAPYRLAPRAAAQLTRPLIRPCAPDNQLCVAN